MSVRKKTADSKEKDKKSDVGFDFLKVVCLKGCYLPDTLLLQSLIQAGRIMQKTTWKQA